MTRIGDDRGAAMVEMAIMAVLLITLTLGIVELTLAAYTRLGLQEAAQDAAIYAAYNPTDPAGAQVRATEASSQLALMTTDVVIACPGPRIRVTVTHDHDYITDFLDPLLGGTLTMTSTQLTDIFSADACVPS